MKIIKIVVYAIKPSNHRLGKQKKQADARGRIRTYKKRRAPPGGDTLSREDGGLEDAGEGALQLLDRLLDQLTEGILDVLRPGTK